MLTKTLTIGDREVTFKSSASTVRLYRAKFGRDILVDFDKLSKSMKRKKDNNENIPIENLEIFENMAYIMAYQADPVNTPKSINAWLDQFDVFSIYKVFNELSELWGENVFAEVKDSKNSAAPRGK